MLSSYKIKTKIILVIPLIISLLFISCNKNDSIVSQETGNSKISGTTKYLDGSVAPLARIELQSITSGRSIYTYCDSLGRFLFSSLNEGSYNLIFRSTNYDLNTSYTPVNLKKDQLVIQDIYIKFNMLDEFVTRQVDTKFFLIKFLPDGAKLGNNYSVVDHLSGYYRSNLDDSVTLSALVYKIPDHLDWNDITIDPNLIPSEFEFLFELTDEISTNGTHEIRIEGENIAKIFSNPANGFAFVLKNDSLNVKLKIPCVDFNNNDFGLKIFYK